jgi:hypothetical protein
MCLLHAINDNEMIIEYKNLIVRKLSLFEWKYRLTLHVTLNGIQI